MDKVTFCKGTLILAIPCCEGMVIASDRLSATIGKEETNSEQKILSLKPRGFKHAPAIFGVFGIASMHNQTHNLTFRAQRSFINFFNDKDTAKISELLPKLAVKIGKDFDTCAKGMTETSFSRVGYSIGSNLFNIVIFYNSKNASKGIRASSLEFNLFENLNLDCHLKNVHDGELEKKYIHAFGITGIVDGILGNDEQYANERNNEIVKATFEHKPADLPLIKAVNLAKFLIKVSSEKAKSVHQGPGGIGSEVDIALLRPNKGVQWIQLES